ncbi:leucine-rich repeat protein [Perkinsela sp. CCAP 1560/4]|nr:leucine-rich repeat protein [Perkinsela sp. CCAP 1560/4]|eukprot:KNH05413.1 leucine-rich repeat protein [Perkinsela sp. CCAP 1560/4]
MFSMAFLLVDPIAIGRADKHSMPHQTLMEMLVADLQDKKCFRDKNGDFHDINSWEGISLTQDGEVNSINLECYADFRFGVEFDDEDEDTKGVVRPGGSIDFQWIPSSVTDFSTSDLNLAGSIDTRTLPRELNDLNLEKNHFSGTFNAAGLP